jgi:hypothetical protein
MTARTIRRTKKMPKDAKWVATDDGGQVFTYTSRPICHEWYWYTIPGSAEHLESGRPPKDFRTTLRRIVSPKKRAKAKAKKVPKDAKYVVVRISDGKHLNLFFSRRVKTKPGYELRRIVDPPKKRAKGNAKMVRADLLDLLRRLRANHPDSVFSVSQMKSGEETKRLWAEVDAVLSAALKPKGKK